jgi:hypothetical protein
MIIPPYDGEDQDQALPPPYQESASPSGRRTSSLYAPSRSDPRERGSESGANPDYPVEKSPPLPPKEGESPAQRVFSVFSSLAWGTTSATSSSRSPNPASASHTSPTQDPLNPAPDAFTRPTPKNYTYLPFQPMTMLGISSNLADGFPDDPSPAQPRRRKERGQGPDPQHPFVSHDITEEDWLK